MKQIQKGEPCHTSPASASGIFLGDGKACTGCAYDHIGAIVDVFGTPRRVCSNAISVRVRNPDEKDIEFLIKFIEYRKKLIIWELE